ncbi:integrase core domain-containing protein [Culturomica massiliensis]|uniref:integrase core domain-containing protein n=1 Tax=Culturomica massiliensis TaxID=1841857 RepID=UPI001D0C0DA0|nr:MULTISPECIES: integrase core domain-containing protein [Odoribacteraceae]
MKTIRIYPNKKAESTIHFLGEILNTFPFPIQRIQTDWGTEFFNYDFQYDFIKFRPIKPRTPHLNGKVERIRQTDKTEFWSLIDLSDKTLNLNEMTIEWQNFYNRKRSHFSLNGKMPWQKLKSVEHLIPIQSDVSEKFLESKEEILPRNYEYLKFIKRKNKKTILQ